MKNNNNQKPVRKPLNKLTLLDRFLFDTAMSDPEICRKRRFRMSVYGSLQARLKC